VNVGRSAIQCVHFVGVDIESDHWKSVFAEQQRERQTDISKADDANRRSAGVDAIEEHKLRFRFGDRFNGHDLRIASDPTGCPSGKKSILTVCCQVTKHLLVAINHMHFRKVRS
jgi:hypothetical protein